VHILSHLLPSQLIQASARMNYSFQAKAGLPTSLFPQGVPVYTGHYHLPQTVPNTSIVYVGSQYQGE
jgi:hypothetical protein